MNELTVEELLILPEQVATEAHKNQVDLGNVPYIEHPRTVVSLCSSKKAKIIAWLHDVLEDTTVTEADPLAREVKIADLTHNSDITRIPHPTAEDFQRLEKYKHALSILTEQ